MWRGRVQAAMALGLAAAGFFPGATAAAVDHGFAVSPAYGQVEIAQDQDRVTYNIQLTNHNDQDQAFALSTVDFESLDDNGGVAFLGTATSELSHKYGLAAWMSLPETALTIPGGKTVTIPITIVNRASLAPGGHYGALLATALTAGSGGPDSVGVKQVLSSLVLLTKKGGLRQQLSLVSQSSNAGWWRLPSAVKQRFHNLGNVHVAPRGVVSVKDPFGREVARGAINEDSKLILPETYRNYATELLGVAGAWWPGRYSIATSYRYDGTDTVQTFKQAFWYIGAAVIWLVVLAIMLLAAAGAWWLRGWRRQGYTKKR